MDLTRFKEAQVTGELVPVCRPGGTIGLNAWTPEGKNNRMRPVTPAFM